jgi:hypothetical protein
MRINNTGSDFAVGTPDGASSARPGPVANDGTETAGSDQVVLSAAASTAFSAIQAVVSSGNYEPDSLLTAGRLIDSALVKID